MASGLKRRFLAMLAGAVLCSAMAVPPAVADRDRDRKDSDRGRRGERDPRGSFDFPGDDRRSGRFEGGFGNRLSLNSAVDLVLSRFGGQVVKAEAQSRDGQLFYLIRVLTPDGTLVRVRVDALTGRID